MQNEMGIWVNIQRELFPSFPQLSFYPENKKLRVISNTLRRNLAALAVRAVFKNISKYLWTDKSAWNKSFNLCACEEPNPGGTFGDSLRFLNACLSYWLLGP